MRSWSLRRHIAVLLSVAVLPIGAVAVWQAATLAEDRGRLSDAALLALSAERSGAERVELSSAFAAIDAFIAAGIHRAPQCAAASARFVEASPRFVFAGVTSARGRLFCRSDGGDPIDISDRPSFREGIADPKPEIRVLARGAATGIPVAVVTKPIFEDGTLAGFFSLSVPRQRVETVWSDPDGTTREVAVMLLGADLAPFSGAETPDWAPEALAPDLRSGGLTSPRLLRAEDRTGQLRSYALAPIAPGQLYELSAWLTPRQIGLDQFAAMSFPVLMWATAVVVAFVALERLVVRPISALRRDLRAFGEGRALLPDRPAAAASEIGDCEDAFREMATRILRDEAQIENDLREKRLLLKEVHHRVKNNLQIITSIVRMQARDAGSDRARRALERLQERILAIATTHRTIYEGASVGSVPAPELVAGVVASTQIDLSNRPAEFAIAAIELEPEAALGVAMIVTEALIAAADAPESARAPVRIALSEAAGGAVRLEVDYAGQGMHGAREALGARIIRASAAQLGACMTETAEGGVARLHLTFARAPGAGPS